MSAIFTGASSFNSDLSSWNVSNVTDMRFMFYHASSFNSDLSSWNVSNVTDTRFMFYRASSFTSDLSSWNVSNVTYMQSMFRDAPSFNSDLSSWNVSNVTYMQSMFRDAPSFNSDLSSWNVSNVFDMRNMFSGASSFNQNLGSWYIILDDNTIDDGDTSRVVTSISAQNTVLNNQSPVYSIDEDSADGASFEIINSTLMLKSTPSYNDKDSYTVTVSSTGEFGTSNSATFDILVNDIPHAPAPFVTTWKTTTPDESIKIPVGGASGQYTVDWGDGTTTDAVTGDATHIYTDAGTYTVSISGDFKRIYSYSDRSNAQKLQSIEQWGDIQWSSMNRAFTFAAKMVSNAQDTPDLSNVTDMSDMFRDASSFNSDLSSWNVSNVTDMQSMFRYATSFTSDLSSWNVSNVTDMSAMFAEATSFTSDLSSWNVSNVTNMHLMFYLASSFTSDLSSWNVSNVTDIHSMFRDATSFNSDLSSWNVSNVTDIHSMFRDATSFNSDLSSWNVSNVTDIHSMFRGASSFNQNLGSWYIILDDNTIDDGDTSRVVTSISAQNTVLNNQSPVYSIDDDSGDGAFFEIINSTLMLKSTPSYNDKNSYTVTILSTGTFGTSNSVTFEILVVS